MATKIECFNCRFFAREDTGRPTDPNEVIPEKGISGQGECRRHSPRHGNTLVREDGSEYDCYGDWPQTWAEAWCGEFEPVPNK